MGAPSGTVTFLFTDIEGSTRLWESTPEKMRKALARHDDILSSVIEAHGGAVFATGGDGLAAAFERSSAALDAALRAQQQLSAERWPDTATIRVRMGLHTGEADERDGDYFGPAVNRAARIMAAGHGGQVLMSGTTASLVRGSLPAAGGMVDLGVHQLKDLYEPESLFQLTHPDLPSGFPPLRAVNPRAHNLPVPRTTFVGRYGELQEVKRLVVVERLVTLTGSGGCGKTRLAVQAAGEVVDQFPDGVWLADLAVVSDPAAVASQVASIFSLKEGPGMTAADAVVAFLGRKQALLILDNCEHVLEAGADLSDRLVSSCPSLHLLATSRQRLDLSGEVAWRVPSLTVPERQPAGHAGPAEMAGIASCDAVQLFVERATRASPGFALTESNSEAVAGICRRLDGIPLAIELAAARLRMFTPAEIATALDERFELLTGSPRSTLPRQQTLEASVDWSHDLLTEAEQIVFRRLAVFAGSFGYDAVVAVCTFPPISPHQVLDRLGGLIDKSLVLMDGTDEQARYRLLETVRDYASRRLARTHEEEQTRVAHRDHYLAFADAAEPHLEGPGQNEWMAMVAADYPNLRVALAWSRAHSDEEQLAATAADIHLYWGFHGPNTEGVAWLDDALSDERRLPPWLRAKTLLARAQLAGFNFDLANLAARAQEGIDLARALNDDRITARFLTLLAQVGFLMGQPDGTVDEAEELARRARDPWALAWSLMLQGAVLYHRVPTAAHRCYEQARQVADTAGNTAAANLAAGFQVGTLWLAGEPSQALGLCDQVAARAEAVGDRMTMALMASYASLMLVDVDELAGASAYADRLELLGAELDMHLWKTHLANRRSRISLTNGDYEAARELAGTAVDLADNPVTRAEMLVALVEAELALEELPEADSHIDEMAAIGQFGLTYYLACAHILRAQRLRIGGEPAAAQIAAHEGLRLAVEIESKSRTVDALELLAGLAAHALGHQKAARLYGAAQQLRDDTGYRRCVNERDRDLDILRSALGPDEFGTGYDQGRWISLEEAVECAGPG